MRISECGVRSARRIQGQLRHASLFRTLHSPLQIENGCRGWNRTSIRAFKGRCPTIRRPGNKWWPARVTRPVLRIKSPLHHFNACRPKIGSPSRSSTSEGWCSWVLAHGHHLDVVLVAACQGLGYTSGIWSPHPELHRTGSHTKGVHRSKCFGGVKIGIPSRTHTGNLTLRTRRLCNLSYGDKASHLRSVSFTDSCPACGSLELLRARRCKNGRRAG